DLTNNNLTNTSFVHANLTQAKLIKVEWNGADLSGATLTGAKLYGTPRFGLKIEGIVCQWVDLSSSGDRSVIQNFTPDKAKEFFNLTPPSLQIIIDLPLSHQANFVLAGTYYKIAQEYPDLIQPPNIEISARRTILSFCIDNELTLFSTAFMAILPFQDATITKKNIYSMVDLMRAEVIHQQDMKSIKIVKQLIIFLSQAIRKAKIIEKTNKNLEAAQKLNFFKAPTRTILTNSHSQNLTLYDNPQFGKKFTNDDDISDESVYAIPDFPVIGDFIKEFYCIG
ncbi:pentapeptide repeat-containing protein, partial [Dolichospermum sp. ST_con]|nr:pentapeptide repeat-containing protein [Dolichospermum sp. ST_con]